MLKTFVIFILVCCYLRIINCRRLAINEELLAVTNNSYSNEVSEGNEILNRQKRQLSSGSCMDTEIVLFDRWPWNSARFNSPWYPSDYPPNQRCLYFVHSPIGTRIQIDCYKFNIKVSSIHDDGCSIDKFKFSTDGNLNSPKRKYSCGSGSIHQLSDANEFIILLETNFSETYAYSYEPYGFECWATLVKGDTTTTTTKPSTTRAVTTTTTRSPTTRPVTTTTTRPSTTRAVSTTTTTRPSTTRPVTTTTRPVTIPTTTKPVVTTKITTTTKPVPTKPPPVTKDCNCGQRQVWRPEVRIVQGIDAGKDNFPWRCNLIHPNLGGKWGTYCGCTVISPNWVLTAAHCALAALEKGGTLRVDIGHYDLTDPFEPHVEIPVKQIFQHENYDKQNQDNDLSLLLLERTLTFANNIQPVCLPFKFAGTNFHGRQVVATGWGLDKYGGTEKHILQKVHLTTYETENCRREFPGYNQTGLITDNMICTYDVGRDMCQGDSGGGIDYFDPETSRFFEVGISSWGIGCAERGKPGAYAKLTLNKFLDWIHQHVGDELCIVR